MAVAVVVCRVDTFVVAVVGGGDVPVKVVGKALSLVYIRKVSKGLEIQGKYRGIIIVIVRPFEVKAAGNGLIGSYQMGFRRRYKEIRQRLRHRGIHLHNQSIHWRLQTPLITSKINLIATQNSSKSKFPSTR